MILTQNSQAISDKIKALDFQDCKVRVLNVDSQASFSNIVVQVIGEMSNRAQPHHKFVETFVLAEQPNGYFVLNDIFRYLNDDEDEIVEDEQIQPEIPVEEVPTPAEGLTDPQPHVDDTVATEDAAAEVSQKLEEEKEQAAEQDATEVNGALVPPPAEQTPEIPESTATTAEVLATETTDAATPEQPAEAETTETEPAAESAAPAPAEAPPAKKTWASMLGGGVKAPAVPALPVTAPAQQNKGPRPTPQAQAPKAQAEPQPTAASSTTASTPTSQSNGWQTADHSKKGNRPQNKAAPEGIVLAYIKNVNEKVDARILREVLESFGELRYFDVSRQRVRILPRARFRAALLTDHLRTAPLWSLPTQPAMLLRLQPTRSPSAANKSMSRSVALALMLMAVVTPTTPAVVATLRVGVVAVECRVAAPAARPTFPRMLDVVVVVSNREVRSPVRLPPRVVVKTRPPETCVFPQDKSTNFTTLTHPPRTI